MNEDKVAAYFNERVAELEPDIQRGTPWVFVSLAGLVNAVAVRLYTEPSPPSLPFEEFFNAYVDSSRSTVSTGYGKFRYEAGTQDLTRQMYWHLVWGLPNNFSFVPDAFSHAHGARERSITLAHRVSAGGITHLDPHEKHDAPVLIAEDFYADVKASIGWFFEDMKNHHVVREKFMRGVENLMPLGVVG